MKRPPQKRGVKFGKRTPSWVKNLLVWCYSLTFITTVWKLAIGRPTESKADGRLLQDTSYSVMERNKKLKIVSYNKMKHCLSAWYNNTGPDTPIVSSEAWNYCLLWLVSRFTPGLLIGWTQNEKQRRTFPSLAWPRSFYCEAVRCAYWSKAGSILSSEHRCSLSPGKRSAPNLVRHVPVCGWRPLQPGSGRLLSSHLSEQHIVVLWNFNECFV
jgi:hypothetical protein